MRLPCISTLVDLGFPGFATFSDAYLDEGRKALQNSRNGWLLALQIIFAPRCNELGRSQIILGPPAGTPYQAAAAPS